MVAHPDYRLVAKPVVRTLDLGAETSLLSKVD